MVDRAPVTPSSETTNQEYMYGVSNVTHSTLDELDYDTPFDSSGLGELLNVLDLYYIPILITVGLIGKVS